MAKKILASFVESLPARPYATDDFQAGLRILSLSRALKMPHIQLHGVRRAYLPFDMDVEGAAFAWEEAGVPAPTIITINPANSHAHYLYGLDVPVAFPDRNGKGNARRGPINFYKLIMAAYMERLQADQSYPGYMTKNPLYPGWETLTYGRTYEMEELADYVDLQGVRLFNRTSVALELEQVPIIPQGYRNDTMFHAARKLAYGKVKLCVSQDGLFNTVMHDCAMINERCIPPLPHRQVIAMARNIAKWCWSHRDRFMGDCKNRGACQFDPMPAVMEAEARKLEKKSRQRTGAEYTALIKRAKTEHRIADVRDQLKAEGKKVTKSAVSIILGIDRVELSRRYSHLFQKVRG